MKKTTHLKNQVIILLNNSKNKCFLTFIQICINLIVTFIISLGLLDTETNKTSVNVQRSNLSTQMLGTNKSIDINGESFEMISEPDEARTISHSQAYVMDHSRQSRNLDFW